jgi:hypothetical protein
MHDLQLSCAVLAVLQDSKVIHRSKISTESEKNYSIQGNQTWCEQVKKNCRRA